MQRGSSHPLCWDSDHPPQGHHNVSIQPSFFHFVNMRSATKGFRHFERTEQKMFCKTLESIDHRLDQIQPNKLYFSRPMSTLLIMLSTLLQKVPKSMLTYCFPPIQLNSKIFIWDTNHHWWLCGLPVACTGNGSSCHCSGVHCHHLAVRNYDTVSCCSL